MDIDPGPASAVGAGSPICAAGRACSRWHLHRRMYDWAMGWAHTPYGSPAMAVLAFCEAIFFPVPSDVLLMALCLSRPKRSFYYGVICVSFSVLGGCAAFGLGLLIGGDRVVELFSSIHLGGKVEQALRLYDKYQFWAVATAALTPVPYMMFSWLGGMAKIGFTSFVVTSLVFRSIRFLSESVMIYAVGPRAKPWIDKYFNLASVLVILLLILLVILLNLVSKAFGV